MRGACVGARGAARAPAFAAWCGGGRRDERGLECGPHAEPPRAPSWALYTRHMSHRRSGLASARGARGFAAAPASAAGLPTPPSGFEQEVHQRRHERSANAVQVALVTNMGVCALKTGVWWATGSAVMGAESMHSAVDSLNQLFLRLGLLRSLRPPDSKHPYGYSKEQFVWSLASSVAFFCVGSGASLMHGFHSLLHPSPMSAGDLVLGGGVAAVTMLAESYSCFVAYKAIAESAKAENMTFTEYTRDGDPVSVAVFFEDVSAVAGSGIAFAALYAAFWLEQPMLDGLGSVGVGGLLAITAWKLFSRNHRSLVGVSMPDRDLERAKRVLLNSEFVTDWRDMKTEVLGPRKFRFKVEIVVNGAAVVARNAHLLEEWSGVGGACETSSSRVGGSVATLSRSAPGGRASSISPSDVDWDERLKAYGACVVDVVPVEVERLERQLKEAVPGIQHVDIELVKSMPSEDVMVQNVPVTK